MTLKSQPLAHSEVSSISSTDFINVEHLTVEEVRQIAGVMIQA